MEDEDYNAIDDSEDLRLLEDMLDNDLEEDGHPEVNCTCLDCNRGFAGYHNLDNICPYCNSSDTRETRENEE